MGAKFCENCGDPVSEGELFCEKCGAKIDNATPAQSPPGQPQQMTQPSEPPKKVNEKNPVLAAILSLIISGVGQIYNGQWKKGILILVVTIIVALLFGLLSLIVVVYAMYDAYTTAQKINNGEPVKDLFS
jgi:TM2 domain-containing membrane protein YozV